MRHSFLLMLAVGASAGCCHARIDCPTMPPASCIQWPTLHPDGFPVPVEGRPIIAQQEAVQVPRLSTSATLVSASIKVESIKQPVQGVNEVRLLAALRTALSIAGYSENRRIPATVQAD